jgi:hypothetical protein
MFSIPKQATTDNLLLALETTINKLINCDIFSAWFIKRRVNDLLNAKMNYSFTAVQEERYKLLVNRFNAFTQYNDIDNNIGTMEKPLIS